MYLLNCYAQIKEQAKAEINTDFKLTYSAGLGVKYGSGENFLIARAIEQNFGKTAKALRF